MVKRVFAWLLRFLLKLRYEVEVKGLDRIQREKEKALVMLPNHPAEVDPIILMAWLHPYFAQRPLVVEKFYYIKGFAWLMRYVKAIPIPDLKIKPSSWSIFKTQEQMKKIFSLCKEKESLMIYPAGLLKTSGKEELGASSITYELVQSRIPIQFLLVRTTGLWGSKFSRYIDGTVPDFNKTLLKGAFTSLLNGIFFLPKRKVTLELESVESSDLEGLDKYALNRYLENWYNQYPSEELKEQIVESEPPSFVSYFFCKRASLKISKEKPKKANGVVPAAFRKEVDAFLMTLTKKQAIDWTEDTQLGRDLNLDSLELAELWIFLSKKCNLTGLEIEELLTVGDVYQIATLSKEAQVEKREKPKKRLCKFMPHLAPSYDHSKETILEVFYSAAKKRKAQGICADSFSGALTYEKFVRAACLLSNEIKSASTNQEKVAILLPSSVGAYVTIISVLLAGKIPVMLNWTLGKKHLEECLTTGGFSTILSSERFLLELIHADLGSICSNIVLLEDLKKKITFKKILRLLMKGAFVEFKKHLRALKTKKEDTAVILFTSGTEGPAKMVPLTHENILANHRGAIAKIELFKEDLFYSMLPPFHSFGFSVTGLLPLLAGLRVYYEANPTQSLKIADDLTVQKPTLLCSPPSFLRSIFAELSPKIEPTFLRLVVSGAEAMTKDCFDLVSRFPFNLIEGYGITECSPIVSMQLPTTKPKSFEEYVKRGLGEPLEGIELKVIDHDTKELLEEGKEGEICVFGKNVFKGYANVLQQTCFITLNGKQFYKTGDRGKIIHNTLFLTGRYKRFVKIGGEMIHLGSIEGMLNDIVKEHLKIIEPLTEPILAVVGVESPDHKTQIFVYTIHKLDLPYLQEALRSKGLSPLFKIEKLLTIDSIPLTGTGKIDYLYLEKSAKTK